jgi:hypothetical protein
VLRAAQLKTSGGAMNCGPTRSRSPQAHRIAVTSQIFAWKWRTGAKITSFGLILFAMSEAWLQITSELDAMNDPER